MPTHKTVGGLIELKCACSYLVVGQQENSNERLAR